MDKISKFPEQHIIQEEAIRWIIMFENGRAPSSEALADLNEWVSKSDQHRETLIELATTWSEMDLLSELVVPTGHEHKSHPKGLKRLLMMLCSPLTLFSQRGKKGLKVNTRRIGYAAVGLSLGILITLTYIKSNLDWGEPSNIYLTSVGEQSSYVLKDGSTVWVNTNSKIEVNYTQDSRSITLHKGEAHFDVSPDEQRPFEVYAGKRVVRAVGTAFSVYIGEENFKVRVSEGVVDLLKVSSTSALASNHTHNQSLRTPEFESGSADRLNMIDQIKRRANKERLVSLAEGQSIEVPVGDEYVIAEIVNNDPIEMRRSLSWVEGKLVFAGETLDEVVREVSRYTNIYIEVVDPDLRDVRIGGQFRVGETDALFDVLESGFGLKVSRLSDLHVQIHPTN